MPGGTRVHRLAPQRLALRTWPACLEPCPTYDHEKSMTPASRAAMRACLRRMR